MKNITNILQRLAGSEKGAVLPLVGLALGVLLLAAGFTIDYTRAQIVKERMQWAVDAAALAGAKMAPDGIAAVQKEANAYFRANFPNGYMGTSGGTLKARKIGTESGKGYGIRYSVQGMTMKNYISNIVGLNNLKISASADVNTVPLSPLDVMFSLDLSGSMDWRDGTGDKCLYSGGGGAGDVDTSSAKQALCRCGAGDGYSNCPAQGTSRLVAAKKQIKKLRDQLDSKDNRFGLVGWDQRTRTGGGTGSGSYKSGSKSPNCPAGWGAWPCNGTITQVLNLTDNKSTFTNRVNNLQAWGNTDHANGMYWAYQKIKDSNRVNRSIVFMTDGWPTMNYNSPGSIFIDDSSGQQTAVLNLFKQQCTKAKNDGITVYTILFNLDASDSRATKVRNAMKACASQTDFFYTANNSASLGAALTDIGNAMMTMRLTR